jgi:ABC-2 type transport system permease protein
MLTVFKHALARSKGAILGWGLTLALLGMMFVPFYDSIAEDLETWEELMSVYPEEIMAFFGEGAAFTTPEGFLSLEYFSFMPLVIGIYAVLAGSGLLAADEERGILDLIAAQPVSRSALFWGRLLGFLVSLSIALAFGYGGIMLATTYSIMELDAIQVITPFLSMFALLVFFAGLALLLSMVLPSRSSASMVAGIVLIGGFFANGLANLNDTLADIQPYLPLHYFQGDNWTEGFKADWFAGLVGVGLLFTLIAWWAFLRRDIRVGGEGGWKLPKLFRRGKAAEA